MFFRNFLTQKSRWACLGMLTITHVAAQEINLDLSPSATNFIVFGDWGRFGDDHQLQVAEQMAKVAKLTHVRFFINVGDNFYPKGVASVHDPQWQYSLEEIYKDFSLQREWYSILGNHDYMGNPDAQVAYSQISRRWRMPARYFDEAIRLTDGSRKMLKFTFIDTNPLIPEFYENAEYGPNVRTQDSTAQKKWIAERIADVGEDTGWNIVVGHHPLYTASETRREGYDTRRIRNSLHNLLTQNNVDIYLCGHDHSLQHLVAEGGVHHFISGAASENTEVGLLPISKFSAAESGFLLFSATADKIKVYAIQHDGKILYQTILVK